MIELQNVHKAFGANKVLRGVNLTIPKASSMVIIGGSGTGKSVALKCILGLVRPDSGTITVDGQDAFAPADRDAFLARFGMLFQGGALFDSLQVWQNVAFRHLRGALKKPAFEARALAVEKLRRVGLTPDVADLYPAELSGGMPLLLQMPIFIILYRTLHDLLWRASSGFDLGAAAARAANGVNGGAWERYGNFEPKHLDASSQLYQDLTRTNEMSSLGMNLAQSAQQALGDGIAKAAPYIVLVMAVAATSYYQQRQIAGRPGAAQVNPQQQMLLKVMPVFFAFISLTLPAGLVVYFLVSNLFRIGQQALITRTMYKDHPDSSPIDTTATDETSAKSGGGIFSMIKEQANASAKAREDVQKAKTKELTDGGSKSTTKQSSTEPGSGSAGKAGAPSRSAPSQANRSKAKKKRR